LVGVQNCLSTHIIQQMSNSKWWNGVFYQREHDGQNIDQWQVHENHIYGLLQIYWNYTVYTHNMKGNVFPTNPREI
jgi:hypothetical protein